MTGTTLSAALADSSRRWGERRALTATTRSLTYRAFWGEAESLAAVYRSMGVSPGDRIVCQLPNRPELLVSAAAAWLCGALHVGADMDLTATELEWLVGRTGASVVLAQPDPRAADPLACLRAVAGSHPSARRVVLDEPGPAGCLPYGPLVQGRPPAPAGEGPDPGHPALILFTSGTTAAPKGVVRHHGQLVDAWLWMADALAVTADDVHLAQLPLTHGFGFGMAIMALLTGGEVVLVERFSAGEVCRRIADHRVTVLHGTPAQFRLVLDRLGGAGRAETLRIGVGSAASFPPELAGRIFDELGMQLLLSYGSSEGMGWGTTDRDDILAGSVGRPPADQVRVVGPDGRTLPAGESGEIVCRRNHSFSYWAEPEAVEDVDPWYHTGDLGQTDGEGRLFVLGRIRGQVNRGGLRVDCTEVENVLARHPDIGDAAVIGLPDEVLGEIVCACVVAAAPPSLDELRRAAGEVLARHKLPEALCILDEVPRTKLGKVDRAALRDRAAETEVIRLRG